MLGYEVFAFSRNEKKGMEGVEGPDKSRNFPSLLQNEQTRTRVEGGNEKGKETAIALLFCSRL